MTPALIVIDIQNDYFPGGRMELVGSDEASAQAHKLLDHFRATARPTFHIQHISLSKTATFFLPDSEGQRFTRPLRRGRVKRSSSNISPIHSVRRRS